MFRIGIEFMLIVAAFAIGITLISRPFVKAWLKNRQAKKAEKFILEYGTTEMKTRLAELREREAAFLLREQEIDQARRLLCQPNVREALIGADVDMAELDELLKPKSSEAIHNEFQLEGRRQGGD